MRKQITLLITFLLVASFSFGQNWQSVKKVNNEKNLNPKKIERGINPYRNSIDGIKVVNKAKNKKGVYQYSPADSPGSGNYSSNTFAELSWTTITVSEIEVVNQVQIDYTWDTDSYASEGSFHLKSPNGTSVVIAAGEGDGTYSVVLTDFNNEATNGDWELWIEDSYGDGGHQATNITFSITTPVANDAGISELVSIDEDAINYEGDKDIIVSMKNFGTQNLLSDSIAWGYIAGEDTTYMPAIEWTGDLAQGETEEINLGTLTLEANVEYQIGAWTHYPNGVADENSANDTSGVDFHAYKKGVLLESFEGTTFPPANWTTINNDGGSKEWEISSSYSYNGMQSASVGYEKPNDDWLITPKLIVAEGDILSFWAISTSSYFQEDFNVLVSKTGKNIEDFTISLEEVIAHPNTWTEHAYTLTDNANISAGDSIYVAVQCVSNDQLRLVVDMFSGPMLASVKDNDLAVDEVITSLIKPGEDNQLKAIVSNHGIIDQTSIDITFKIDGEEVGSIIVDELAYMESDTVAITWTTPSDITSYNLEVSVDEDDNNDNNILSSEIFALAEIAGYLMDLEDDNLMSINLPNSQDLNLVSSYGTSIYAGTWANGKWYGVTKNNDLVTINYNTGAVTEIATLELGSVTGIAYDWTTGTMYAADYDSGNGVSLLYTVNITTGEVQRVGLGSTPGININLACDLDGNLFATNLDDNLYSISKFAGTGTAIGELGIDINYAQDMEFDHENGDVLYAPAYTDKGGLYVINTESGTATLLGEMDHECAGFAIPYVSPAPNVVEMNPANNSEDNAVDTDIHIIFDQNVDSVDFSGITISGDVSGVVSNISAELTDSLLTISHDAFANDDIFTITIPSGTVTAEEVNAEIVWSFGTIMPAPEALTFTPFHGATGIALDGEISLVFNQEISDNNLAGITVISTTDGPIGGLSAIIADDNKTLTIAHDAFITNDDEIAVAIPADAVANEDGVMNLDTSWTFTTLLAGQPIADSIAPANNERTVALDANVLVRFSTAITEIDLSGVTINGPEGDVTGVVATLADSTVSIAHDAFANNNDVYTVTIPGDAVTAAGVNNSEIQWSFTTILAAPEVVEYSPIDGATSIALDEDILIEFNQLIDDSQVDMDTLITIIGENEDTVKNISASIAPDGKIYVSHDDMEYNNAVYTVTIPANMVHNVDSVMNAEETTWTFTTILDAPEVETFTPDSGVVDVALDAEISLLLNQDLVVNDLSIVTISSDAMGPVENVSGTLGDDNRTITLAHDNFFTVNDDIYTVTIPASAVQNNDGVYNQDIVWTFQTVYTYDITFNIEENSDALADATITFDGRELATNSLGAVVFEDVVKADGLEYTVSKDGYKTKTAYVDVTGNATLVVNLEKIYTVTFNVTNGTDPLENAVVTFSGRTDTCSVDGVAEFVDVNPGMSQPYIVALDGYYDATGILDIVDQNVVESVVLTSTVGIENLDEFGIKIYPNPSNGVFYINNTKVNNLKLTVRDITGKVVLIEELNENVSKVDITEQASGVYFIQLENGEKTFNSKIIIK